MKSQPGFLLHRTQSPQTWSYQVHICARLSLRGWQKFGNCDGSDDEDNDVRDIVMLTSVHSYHKDDVLMMMEIILEWLWWWWKGYFVMLTHWVFVLQSFLLGENSTEQHLLKEFLKLWLQIYLSGVQCTTGIAWERGIHFRHKRPTSYQQGICQHMLPGIFCMISHCCDRYISE